MDVDEQVGKTWVSYRGAVRNLYEKSADGAMRVSLDQLAGGRLAELTADSERLAEACLDLRRDEWTEAEAEAAALACAAVDVAVAVDLLEAANELGELSRWPMPEIAAGALAAWPEPEFESETLEELLQAGDVAFLGAEEIGGAAPATDARERAQEAVDLLVDRAAPVARSFGTGVISLAGGDLIAALGQIDFLRSFAASAKRLAGHALRLAVSGLRKLIGTVGGSESLATGLGAIALPELAEKLRAGIDVLTEQGLRRLVRAERAETQLDEMLPSSDTVGPGRLRVLEGELDDLCLQYSKRMKSAGAISRWTRRGAPLLAGVAGVGMSAVAALHGAGLAYVLYSLTVRIDTAPSLRMKGVVELVRRAR